MTSSQQEQAKALCRFKNTKEKWTVGDVFDMHCEWPPHLAVLSAPVRIEFPSQKQKELSPYSLVILHTQNILPGKGTFKVTAYRVGSYNTGFQILSDQGEVEVQPLSWKVESVLVPGQQVQPYPPYGPWRDPLPFWYGPALALLLISFLTFLALKVRLFIRRKKKIKEVQARRQKTLVQRLSSKDKQPLPRNKEQHYALEPYQEFISQLNMLSWKLHTNKGPHSLINEVEQAFRLFLENEFFIYALDKQAPTVITRQLKKYYPWVYQKQGKGILSLFAELNRLGSEKAKPEDVEQVMDMARKTVFSCKPSLSVLV